MVNKLLKSTTGMSLLEVLLAITMLGVLAVGSANMMGGVQALAKRANQRVALQQDSVFAMKKFENFIMERQNEMDLGFGAVAFSSTNADAFTLNLTTFDKNDLTNVDRQWKITVVYDRRAGRNSTLNIKKETPVDAEDRWEKIAINGFRPWALLKDYNTDGKIDSADAASRDACIADFTTCNAKHVTPMVEVSPAGDMIYFSVKPARENTKTKLDENVFPGITKVVYLQQS